MPTTALHRVTLLAFPPAQLLDVSGPLEVFAMANQLRHLQGQPPFYRLSVAAPQPGPLATTCGVVLHATSGLRGLRSDTLLVAGGPGARLAAAQPPTMALLRRVCDRTPRVGSICTGAFALAATGLLDGLRATTHWAHLDEFAQAFPRVHLERDALFLAGQPVHTTAGISAGMDYALSLVEADLGRAMALSVARGLVLFLKRPGGQSQFSAPLASQAAAASTDRFAALCDWMAAHLRHDLSVRALADRAGMSERSFARHFTHARGATPARHVLALRVDAARRLLTEGRLPVARVAERCGFPSAEAMRVAFQRQLGVSPSDFRARFDSTGHRPARA